MAEVNFSKLTSAHFHAWNSGLKTGMYYLRTRAKADAIPFTIDHIALKEAETARDAISSGLVADNGEKGTEFPAPENDETDDAESVGPLSSGSSVDGDMFSSELTLSGAPLRSVTAAAQINFDSVEAPETPVPVRVASRIAGGSPDDENAVAPLEKKELNAEEAKKAANEAKKAAIREQMRNGSYIPEGDTCFNVRDLN
jgi:hypothetical protein